MLRFPVYAHLLTILLLSCSLNPSLRSRELLARCTFSLEKVELLDMVLVDSLKFRLFVKVENPNEEVVLIDSLAGFVLLDSDSVLAILHSRQDRVAAKSSGMILFDVSMSVRQTNLNWLAADSMAFVGKVWSRLDVLGSLGVTVESEVNIRRPLPKKRIEAAFVKLRKRLLGF